MIRRSIHRETILTVVVMVLWATIATSLALERVPYDDEWFSLWLALDVPADQTLAVLRGDRHPPWVGLLDARLASFWSHRAVLNGARLIASVVSFGLLARVWRKGADAAPIAIAVAAFHPIVLFYGGSARWYPFLLLGQALRAWALWVRPSPGAFVGGALIGTGAGYVDLPFLALDAFWWLRRRESRWVPAAAVGAGMLLLLVSPLGPSHPWTGAGRASRLALSSTAIWIACGIAGDAHPRWPLTLGLLAPAFAYVRGVQRLFLKQRPFALWLLSVAGCWLVATQLGVGHPRYSLMPVLLFTAAFVTAAARATHGVDKGLAVVAVAYLSVGSWLTYGRQGMVRADLQPLPRSVCTVIGDEPVLSAYERLTAQLWNTCGVRVVDLADVDGSRHGTIVLYMRRNWGRGNILSRQAEIDRTLRERCRLTHQEAVAPVEHADLRSMLGWSNEAWIYTLSRWHCPAHRAAPMSD